MSMSIVPGKLWIFSSGYTQLVRDCKGRLVILFKTFLLPNWPILELTMSTTSINFETDDNLLNFREVDMFKKMINTAFAPLVSGSPSVGGGVFVGL